MGQWEQLGRQRTRTSTRMTFSLTVVRTALYEVLLQRALNY